MKEPKTIKDFERNKDFTGDNILRDEVIDALTEWYNLLNKDNRRFFDWEEKYIHGAQNTLVFLEHFLNKQQEKKDE